MTRNAEHRTAGMLTRAMDVKAIDKDRRAVEALMSTGVVDRHGEAIEPKAFEAMLPEFVKNPVLLADHDHTKQIGHWENVRVTAGGLEGTAIFAETPTGNEHFALYADGHRKAFSVGFLVHESETESRQVDGKTRKVRVFKKVELLECSSVAIPANREALVVMALGAHRKGEQLGARIESRRNELDLTLEQVAADLPITASTLGQIERGEIIRPPDEVLRAIAEALDLSFEELQRLADADAGEQDDAGGGDDEHATLTVGAARRLVRHEIGRELQAQLPQALGDALDQRAGREAHSGMFDRAKDSNTAGGGRELADYFGG